MREDAREELMKELRETHGMDAVSHTAKRSGQFTAMGAAAFMFFGGVFYVWNVISRNEKDIQIQEDIITPQLKELVESNRKFDKLPEILERLEEKAEQDRMAQAVTSTRMKIICQTTKKQHLSTMELAYCDDLGITPE